MKNKHIFVMVASIALAMLACAVPDLPIGDGSLFKDDFSGTDGGWGTGTDAESSVEVSGGEFVMQVFKDSYYVWSYPGEDSLQDVHVEVTAKNVGGGTATAFGLICAHQVTDQYYYFGISSAGDYVIAITRLAQEDEFLTNSNQWATSPDITPNAASYRIGADCKSDGTLTLYVDGKQIDSVQETTFTSGDAGLFTWTGSDTSADIRFDDFVVTSLAK